MCPYFFQYFCIAHVSFARTLVIFYACSAYLVGNDRHVLCTSIVEVSSILWHVRALDLETMINFSTRVNMT
jgi:hypothetical protein